MISPPRPLLFKEDAIVGTSTRDGERLDFKDNRLGLALGVEAGDLVDGDGDGVAL